MSLINSTQHGIVRDGVSSEEVTNDRKNEHNGEKLDHETFTPEMGELNQEQWSRVERD